MAYLEFVWTDEIIAHLAEHEISRNDFEHVVQNPLRRDVSRSSGLPLVKGYTADGRYIVAVYEELDEMTVLPVTAYEVSEP
jgi:hypothetical protein